jgi:hypothetical protein
LRKMAAYRRFTATNKRIATSTSFLPIEFRPLDPVEPVNGSRLPLR